MCHGDIDDELVFNRDRDSTDGDTILETFVHPRILEVGHIEVWTGRDDYYNYNHKKSLSSFDFIFRYG